MEIEGTDEQNREFHLKMSQAETFEWFVKLDELIEEQQVALDALKEFLE